MSDKSVQKEYEYSDILKTVIDVVSERSEDKIVSENSVLRNILEHKYDDTESLEILMDIETIYKIPNSEKPELEQKLLNAKTVGNFCDVFYMFLNNKKIVEPKTQADVFTIIRKRIYEKYNVYAESPEVNWFKDLGLSEFQRAEFFKWVSLNFGINMNYFYFKDLQSLCNAVLVAVQNKRAKQTFKLKVENFIERATDNMRRMTFLR